MMEAGAQLAETVELFCSFIESLPVVESHICGHHTQLKREVVK
jgi:hypothetical protein